MYIYIIMNELNMYNFLNMNIYNYNHISAAKHKTYLRNGLKDVQKHLRKGEKG